MDFAGEVEHTREACERFLALRSDCDHDLSLRLVVDDLLGTNCHTGLSTEAWTSRAKLSIPAKPASASLRSWLWSLNPIPSLCAIGRSLTPPMNRSTSRSRQNFANSSGFESSTMTVSGSHNSRSWR